MKSLLGFGRPEVTRFTCRREPELRRGSRQSRGYDRDWEKLSVRVAAEEPLCCECLARGRVTVGQLRDHTLPIRDRPELRLKRSNVRNWCKHHHDTIKRALEAEARKLGDIDILEMWVSDPATRPPHLRP